MIALGVINGLAVVLCVVFVAYVVAILVPFIRRPAVMNGDPAGYEWHFIIPCLNEALVIEESLQRLRHDHPIAHVWCVDDNSDDATGAIIARQAERDAQVHLISRRPPNARNGKGEALNEAWRRIMDHRMRDPEACPEANVIVGVLDADGRLDERALHVISGEAGFADPSVGAVQIQVRMINRGINRPDGDHPAAASWFGRLLVSLQDLEFRTVIAAMQHFRHRMWSAGMGGNGQFSRLSALSAVADGYHSPWHGALLEDFEFGLHVLLIGMRNRYCDDTWVAQEALTSVVKLVKQRARWSQGGMQCAKYLKRVLTSPRLSYSAALEIGYFLLIPWTQVLGTLIYASALIVMFNYAVTTPGGLSVWFLNGAWGILPLTLLFGFLPLAVWAVVYRARCERDTSRPQTIVLAIGYWLYTYLMLVSVWTALWRLIRRQNGWVKTPRMASLPGTSPIFLARDAAAQVIPRPVVANYDSAGHGSVSTSSSSPPQSVGDCGRHRSSERSDQAAAYWPRHGHFERQFLESTA